MGSKLLTKGSEMYGKKKGDPDHGLMGEWAGTKMGKSGIIAPASRGRQYDGVDGGSQHRRCAPQREGKALTKDKTGGPSQGRSGYGKV